MVVSQDKVAVGSLPSVAVKGNLPSADQDKAIEDILPSVVEGSPFEAAD